MKKEPAWTKVSFGIDIAAVFVLLIYFAAVAPYPPVTTGGFLILSPPIFGIFGLITAIAGRNKNKTNLSVTLMIVNIIFIFWWPIFWIGGTLLFGV